MEGSTRRVPIAPPPSSAAVSAVMRGNRKTDTRPEIALRSALHRRGHRFRKNVRPEPDINCRVDILFRRTRLVIFVDGCFWHGCPKHGTSPRTNAVYWTPKIARNVERDRANDELLARRGWQVLRTWEHEPPTEAVSRIEAELHRLS
jgi:DNA mismatch endonuclease (patch repair protein)